MLELSTKYAIQALLHLAKLEKDQYLQVKTLSRRAKIPGPYLSKVIKDLASKGIVETKRGALGGVRLPSSKKSISFLDVCKALEDPLLKQSCFLTKYSCNSQTPCIMHRHWLEMKEQMIAFLEERLIR